MLTITFNKPPQPGLDLKSIQGACHAVECSAYRSCFLHHASELPALKSTVGQTVQGRLTLRGVDETLITLKYLSAKDDPTIWLQHRNYGASQSKLAYLKYDEADPPAFVSRELIRA